MSGGSLLFVKFLARHSSYVSAASEPERKLDLLLCSALIEARSCERVILAEACATRTLLCSVLTYLLACEARHYETYISMANES